MIIGANIFCVVATVASNLVVSFFAMITGLAPPAAALTPINKRSSYDQAMLEEPLGLPEVKEEEEGVGEEGEEEREEEEAGEEEGGQGGGEEGEEGGGVEAEWEMLYEYDSEPFPVSFCFTH